MVILIDVIGDATDLVISVLVWLYCFDVAILLWIVLILVVMFDSYNFVLPKRRLLFDVRKKCRQILQI